MDKREFEAEIVDGKPVIKAQVERIVREDGKVDVIIHAPALELINKLNKE